MQRRTKIVATLGPATDETGVLEKLIVAGVNVVRLNFSHGSAEEHKKRAQQVRLLAKKHHQHVAVLGDLQGPKIRISRFANGPISLKLGDKFTLDAEMGKEEGHQQAVGIDYKELPNDCMVGDLLLLNDGRVVLKVENIKGKKIYCTTEVAGTLSNNKGINRQGGGLSAPALTEKDIQDIGLAAKIDVDYLAVSFPRCAEDIINARRLLNDVGGHAGIIAKIERAEVVINDESLDSVIRASDAVMVARGDLGVEIGDAELVVVQKRIISRARNMNKCVITATQMMESMINSPLPTRAEVFDVANAVLDGTDAVMLSGETAAGKFPVETVKAMTRAIGGAEIDPSVRRSMHRLSKQFHAVDESIGLAAMYTANHLKGVKAIIAFTESGSTTLLMSRINSFLPIYAFSRAPKTQARVALFLGVESVPFDNHDITSNETNLKAIEKLREKGIVEEGDLVIITKGDHDNLQGGTNGMKILRVGPEK
ncbi:pyruvate kinase [Candidatus Endobugula sertula]|uniref:Pyruvate kinase n=1 Tax=Candidatus Endobugula sertula TaxID=62101 RepID=A0A1D2QQA5_9GAMM|nr:pyruvate kinase [Candidatus Endobugula sertula]